MNCRTVQRQLLYLPDPGRPPAVAADHLHRCAACRDWLHQLLEIERSVPHIPVPPPAAREALWSRLAADAGLARPTAGRGWSLRWPLLAAAAVLVAVLALVGFPGRTPEPARPPAAPDPFLASLMQRHLSLARADSALSRVVTLADLADDLYGQAAGLAGLEEGADLTALADWFGRVVDRGLVAQAAQLPAAQRRAALEPVVSRLAAVERSAGQLGEQHPAVAVPLRSLADAARRGQQQLGPLAGGGRAVALAGVVPWLGGPDLRARGVLAVAAWAGPVPDYAEQVRRFRRNRDLIAALVDGGLQLAAQLSPQDRAEHCLPVIARLAAEIGQAARAGDGDRAVELARHLRAVLETGVAGNLDLAAAQVPLTSPGNQELLQVGRQVLGLTRPLEAALRSADTDQQRAAQAIAVGRLEVERVLRPRGALE